MYQVKGRPYSSTHTTAYFGSRAYPHNKDYRMNPKVAMYQPDGYGRDTYIKEPNGGFRKEWTNKYRHDYYNKMSLTDYLKSCNITPKFPIYRANGTGRDMYIKGTCGGFYHPQSYPIHYTRFFGELRNYEYDPIVNERLVKNKYDYQNYATVGTLTYLARAGRVKAAKAFFGNLFSVKPLLYNNRAGENVSYSKAKGRKGSIEALALEIKKYITNPEKQEKIYIVHGDCLDDANELKNKIMELIPELKEVEVTELDPIVGASCGPDTLIVGFKGKFVEEVSE